MRVIQTPKLISFFNDSSNGPTQRSHLFLIRITLVVLYGFDSLKKELFIRIIHL